MNDALAPAPNPNAQPRRGTPGGPAGPGRKRQHPTEENRRMIQALAALGASPAYMARKLNTTVDTIRRHYAGDVAHGLEEANTQVAAAIFKRAKAGDLAAAKWWMAVRAGWVEKFEVKHSGKIEGERERIIVLPAPVSAPGEWAALFRPEPLTVAPPQPTIDTKADAE